MMIDWPSRLLLAITSALVAFATTGAVLPPTDPPAVALATPSTAGPTSTTPPLDPLAALPALPAPTPTPTPTPPPPLTLAFGGDVHGEPPIENVLAEGGNPLEGVADVLGAADVAVVNLETAVGSSGVPADKEFTFQADPALLDALADAGVDVVSMANNHALDFGRDAATETRQLVEAAGLASVGYGEDEADAYAPHVVEVGGRTVALLGLSRVLPSRSWEAQGDRAGMASAYDPSRALQAIRDAGALADHVVVVIHWGQERHTCPNGNQLELAGAFAAAGADLVVGHHPHVLQGVDNVGDTLVAYSLGNLAFYATRASQRLTGVLTVTLGEGGVVDHRWDPAVIDGRGRPQPVPTQAEIPAETSTVTTGTIACGPPR